MRDHTTIASLHQVHEKESVEEHFVGILQSSQELLKTPKTQKLGLTGTYRERGNFAFLQLFAGEDEGGLSLPLPRRRVACCRQIMLVKRLPDQGLDHRLAADV